MSVRPSVRMPSMAARWLACSKCRAAANEPARRRSSRRDRSEELESAAGHHPGKGRTGDGDAGGGTPDEAAPRGGKVPPTGAAGDPRSVRTTSLHGAETLAVLTRARLRYSPIPFRAATTGVPRRSGGTSSRFRSHGRRSVGFEFLHRRAATRSPFSGMLDGWRGEGKRETHPGRWATDK